MREAKGHSLVHFSGEEERAEREVEFAEQEVELLKKEGTIFREVNAQISRKSTASLNAVRLHCLHRNRGIVRLIKCCTVCIKFSAQKSRFCGCVRPALNAVRPAINFSTEIEVRPVCTVCYFLHSFRGGTAFIYCCTACN